MALAGHPTVTRVKEAVGTSGMRGDAGMSQCQHGSHLWDRSSKRLPWPEGRDCDLFARLQGVRGGCHSLCKLSSGNVVVCGAGG